MTNEEAIRCLQEDKALYETSIKTPDGELLEILHKAIKALGKQVAKYPNVIEHKGTTYWNCPTCTSNVANSEVGRRYLHHCGICGQRIWWSEEAP